MTLRRPRALHQLQVLEGKAGTGPREGCDLSVGVAHSGLQVLMGGQNAVAGGEGKGRSC